MRRRQGRPWAAARVGPAAPTPPRLCLFAAFAGLGVVQWWCGFCSVRRLTSGDVRSVLAALMKFIPFSRQKRCRRRVEGCEQVHGT